VAFIMFLGLFVVFAATLVIAGIGRLAAVVVMAVAGLGKGRQAAPAVPAKPAKAAGPAKPAKPAKKEPSLSPEWTAAVARADARAAARAKAEAGPAVRVSVRELPSPDAPARDIKEVSALVESATDSNGTPGTVPRAFAKPPMPAAKSLLDTGSLVSLHGTLQAGKAKQQAQARKAG
jgi:hypothetical protein